MRLSRRGRRRGEQQCRKTLARVSQRGQRATLLVAPHTAPPRRLPLPVPLLRVSPAPPFETRWEGSPALGGARLRGGCRAGTRGSLEPPAAFAAPSQDRDGCVERDKRKVSATNEAGGKRVCRPIEPSPACGVAPSRHRSGGGQRGGAGQISPSRTRLALPVLPHSPLPSPPASRPHIASGRWCIVSAPDASACSTEPDRNERSARPGTGEA